MITRVTASPVFKRLDGGNLEVTVPITIAEALRGATIEVPTLDGTKKIKVPAGTKHGTVQRLRGEGPPKPRGKGRGDIRYRLEIEVPQELTEEQAEGGRRGWPRRSTAPTPAPSCCGGRRDERIRVHPTQWGQSRMRRCGGERAPDRVSVDDERGVFMISVAAELAHMHPQTLRMYEARGLIEPQRSPKNTRLYSQRDVERLRHIQQLTSSGPEPGRGRDRAWRWKPRSRG